MVYEVYIDSLFVMNFVMNLYLLLLVRLHFPGTATPGRVFCGAAVGAASYVTVFFLPEWGIVKWVVAWLVGTALMLRCTFGLRGIKGFCRILLVLTGYSFLMGGLLLFLENSLPFLKDMVHHAWGLLLLGTLIFLLLMVCERREKKYLKNSMARATLIAGQTRLCVNALIDSGNSLVEPVSGKPVCVIDQKVFQVLFKEQEIPYRAIPYQSIGKSRGILRGYLLPGLLLEYNDIKTEYRDVFVAVSTEECRKVIVNPQLLEQEERKVK